MLSDLAWNVFGVSEAVVRRLPIYEQMKDFNQQEVDELIKLRVLCYSKTTWSGHASGIKKYIKFCEVRNLPPFPVNFNVLNLCLLNLANEQKSHQVIEKTVNSVVFVSKFLGVEISSKDPSIRSALKFSKKFSKRVTNKKDGFSTDNVRELYNSIEVKGGLQSLSKSVLRTFMMIVFCHQTL